MPAKTTANRLIHESSPYLLQHAHNPVDWYPWGDEAFARAREEGKAVFLSIGYSSCHWCHVMERESFADEEAAQLLNRAFVCVKVDREERPDVDHFYMRACQALSGNGGWPLTAFLAPDRRPFYAGTYFTRERLLSLTARMQVLWRTDRETLLTSARELMSATLERFSAVGHLPETAIEDAARLLMEQYDSRYGGFGGAPKFPCPHNLLFLMRAARNEAPDSGVWRAVSKTLDAMARGGLRDHLGGGFCRYSTDEKWLVPHFEKMLYYNALLMMACAEHFEKTGSEVSAALIHETAAYVFREMTDQETGMFYTAQDADTQGEEGRFYTFTPEEIEDALGEDADYYCQIFNIHPKGHLKGRSVINLLHLPKVPLFDPTLRALRETLFELRKERLAPFLDSKCLLSSNALMAAALAKAGAVLGQGAYQEAAALSVRGVLRHMRGEEGRLLAVWTDGRAGPPATLDGYAYLIWALIELYEADYDAGWLEEAGHLSCQALELFEGENGGLYFSGRDVTDLPRREINAMDGAVPSGQSVMAMNLLRLSRLLEREEWEDRARGLINSLAEDTARQPAAFPFLLAAQAYLMDGGAHVAATDIELLRAARRGYRPYLTTRLMEGDTPQARVCLGKSCYPAVETVRELAELLEKTKGG
ncbi:MAG: thioredoxin domain-containing protein [Oscillospiraceae bacterium]|nr:thioredoxin domain-containing protein [Oscillospiraceae bacterium]